MPVHYGDQVEEAPSHGDVGNVGGPHLVRSVDRHAAQQVGIDPMLRCGAAGLWLGVQRFKAVLSALAPAGGYQSSWGTLLLVLGG